MINSTNSFPLTIVKQKKFNKDIKAFKYRLLRPHGIYLKIKQVRLEYTYTYVSNLILTTPKLKHKLEKNSYFMFLADVEQFKYIKAGTETPAETEEKELLRYVMSFARLTDKYLLLHIINNPNKVNIKKNIKTDIMQWFKFFYKDNDNVFNDYCSFIKLLHKVNKTKGLIKTEYDLESVFENNMKNVKQKKENKLPKYYDEPSLDWI